MCLCAFRPLYESSKTTQSHPHPPTQTSTDFHSMSEYSTPGLEGEDSGSGHHKMHNFWTVPDLVRPVVNSLEQYEQARMARLCKAIWPIAASYLWARLVDLRPLLLLVVNGVFLLDDEYALVS